MAHSDSGLREKPKPNLLRGRAIDLLTLNPESFENFTYLALSEIGPLHGFRVVGGASGSSDTGFDTTGERIQDKKTVCIQCKRLASPFHLHMIGAELAKVGLKSALEGSEVREHFILAAGTVGNSLRSALREVDRGSVRRKAMDAAEQDPELKQLREQAAARSLNLRDTVDQYVRSLDLLRVWSGRDFDQELGRVWSKISPNLERFFALEVVLREHPRPDFDLDDYLLRCASDSIAQSIALGATPSDLPPNLFRTRSEDPLTDERGITGDGEAVNVINQLVEIRWGACRVVHGPGGAGKTTTLASVRRLVAERLRNEDDTALPVLCRLSSFSGSLKELIHQSLRIHSGEWLSLPNQFYLLLDGLDEVPSAVIQPLLDELETILHDRRVGCVVALRSGGLRHPASLRHFDDALRLQPLTIRKAIEIAQFRIPAGQRRSFLDQLRVRLNDLGAALLFLPFGHAEAAKMFMESGVLPVNSETLLDGIVKGRLERNRHRARTLEDRLRDIPDGTVRALGEATAFQGRIVMQRGSFTTAEIQAVVTQSLYRVQTAGAFGASTLSDIDAYELLRHYEFIEPNGDERVRLCHDLLADFLAGPVLAGSWQAMIGRLESNIGEGAWLRASRTIPAYERAGFLTAVFAVDPVLASLCAKAIGGDAQSSLEAAVAVIDCREGRLAEYEAATCMGILETPTLLAKLRERMRTYPKHSNRYYQAMRALARFGDIDVLKAILNEEEPGVSAGLAVSGGGIDLWQRAPANITVSIARARLDANPGEARIVLSIRTLAAFGDESDFERVLRVFDQTRHLPASFAAGNCLHTLDSKRAVQELAGRAKGQTGLAQLPYLELLSGVGQIVDCGELLEWLLATCPNNEEDLHSRRRVLKIVCKNPLPSLFEPRLRDSYVKGDCYQRSDIWQIATAHGLASFDDIAMEVFSNPDLDEIGLAANFAKVRQWDEERHATFLQRCAVLARVANGTEWYLPQLLEYLLSRDRVQEVATIVESKMRDMIPRFKVVHRVWLQRVRSRGVSPSSTRTQEDDDEVRLSLSIPPLIKVAAEVSHLIPFDVARDIVGVDLSNAGDEARAARRIFAARLPPDVADAVILELPDADERIQVLADISELGPTENRIQILCHDVATMLRWPPGRSLSRSVENLWSKPVAMAVAAAVAEMRWDPKFGSQLAREVVNVVAGKMTPDVARDIVSPLIPQARSQESKEILQWWHDIAIRPRP